MNFSKRCGVTLEEMVAHMSRNFSLDWSSGSEVDVIAAKGVWVIGGSAQERAMRCVFSIL